ncbi:calmodulin-regulated spectrin-associated protein 2a isoform X3 [Clupea harengus]|uniref:Calmodulin-regulated spectrin-associated protein 2a isoform X3 n=1 Tax=Clupea harengus TaxID=7950 RepID=A0A6P8FTM5_CLUHA|nr:calmodulin-regulated spectrin-associated protein 2a isoform X3 [Clupea harengus]
MGDLADAKEIKKTFIVPTIKSFEHYDFNRAKISSSLTWLVTKAYGTDSVPGDLKEPFYTDQYEQEHLKPPVVSLLLSAELYCRAGSLILKSDAAKPLLGHDAVIQALAQKGLYVTDQERLVTERDLSKRPIQMSAHLALIDVLMMAYTVETVSVEKVVACLQQYSTMYPDGDTPYDTEDAITSWMNKVNEYLKDIIMQEQRRRENQSAEPAGSPRARYRKEQVLPKTVPWIPPVDNLLKDSTDGCALAALLHFYCPDIVKLEDICLKETMSLADSLYNLQLVQEFCKENLNSCCHFSLEDMLYASSSFKNNYLVFMAELFRWFEVVKPSFVQPRVLDAEEPAPSLKKLPSMPISNATKRSFMEKPPSPDRPSLPLRPQPRTSNSGEIKRSTSMSFVDGCLGTWPKEKRAAVHGVSFDIPFDKDEMPSVPSRGMTRSASSEGLGFKVHQMPRGMKRNLSFQPVNGTSMGIEEEGCPDSLAGMEPDRRQRAPHPRMHLSSSNGLSSDGHGNGMATPSIEEALEIIHNSQKQQQRGPQAEGTNQGFFLHLQSRVDLDSKAVAEEGDLESVSSKGAASTDTTEVDTGIHVRTEDIQETLDEDSSLKDYTVSMDLEMDQDYEMRASQSQGSTSPCPSNLSGKSPGSGGTPSCLASSLKMTSFAEQKFRKICQPEGKVGGSLESPINAPDGSDVTIPHSVSWAPTPEESPVHKLAPRDPAQAMAAEMVQLRMRLEEKRRAIEAQKKKVEAAFTRHRQKVGRSAFLSMVRRKGDETPSPMREEAEDGKAAVAGGGSDGILKAQQPLKSPGGEEGVTEADLLEYTHSIDKLNSSLNFLQTEMQRLAQQQEVIMQMREQQSWVIAHSSQQQGRTSSAARSSGSPSPADSPRSAHRSPTSIKRKSASFHSKTTRAPRPNELKIAPFSRVLTAPQSVDSIPRLRRFSPSQPEPSCFVYMGESRKKQRRAKSGDKEALSDSELLSPDGMTEGISIGALEILTFPTKDAQLSTNKTTIGERSTEEGGEKEQVSKTKVERQSSTESREKPGRKIKPAVESKVSEVLTQTVTEKVIVTPTEAPADFLNQSNKNLIEVPLSVLKPLDGSVLEESGEQGAMAEGLDDDQKTCRGFFFKDDLKGETDMALKRAALLEKRLKRERENQQKKQQQEVELEQKKGEARLKAEEDRMKKEEEKARREFIKQEYMRRKQLKLMEDMDTVIKPRTPSTKQRRPRPKSMHRDILDSPRTPIRAAAGSRPRVFSVSSLSLASLNLGDDNVASDKRTGRSYSLASGSLYFFLNSPKMRKSRPDSADGCLSPTRSSSRNGEKDWENGSTTSSVASNTEYTGPKLYKEPSAKSNKHIIQNALSHCCMAGKVNEAQKNKILEEMEKSGATNFLVLFRDTGCQFRSLYTYCPEAEESTKLAGVGPKSISPKMIEYLYKYNSDRKQFSQIPAKTMSASVDAITIHGHLWQTKKPGTPKKAVPAKS